LLDGGQDPVLMKAGSSALVGYNYRTGKNEWATLRYTDRAVGIECGRGMAFALDPRKEKIQAVDAATGAIKFELPATGCSEHYNCGEVVLHGTFLYVSTNSGFAKYAFGTGGSSGEGAFDVDAECAARASCGACTENDAIGCKWSAGACASACTAGAECNEGAGTCPATDWCAGVASYDWYGPDNAHPADAFFLERSNADGDGVAGLWIANAFFGQHPGGTFPLLSLDTVTLEETDATCAVSIGVLPLDGAPDGTTDMVGAQAHHGRAHLTEGGVFKPTVVALVEKHLVGYSYSQTAAEGTCQPFCATNEDPQKCTSSGCSGCADCKNPCGDGHPLLWFQPTAA
jgi:hypothetical protein